MEGIGQVVFSPLAQGILTGKYRQAKEYPKDSRARNPLAGGGISVFDYLCDESLETTEKLRKIADDAGISLAEMALAWVLRLPAISSALIGASTPEQVEMNVKAVEIKLSEDILAKIETVLGESRYHGKNRMLPW
jgi:aryl-alcohol dehydrogenase-like predicted oxidoreductase